MTERTRALLVLFAAAAAAGIWVSVTRPPPRKETPPAATGSAPAPAPTPSVAPPRAATKDEVQSAIATLERGVKAGAATAESPWALAHGLIAFGPELEASNGRKAIDVIGTFAEESAVDGQKLWLFPEKKGEELVEPHPFLLAKTLLEIGIPLGRSFVTATGAKVTLERLVHDAHRAAKLPETSAEYHQMAWTLSLFVAHHRLEAAKAEKEPGPTFLELTKLGLARLERDHAVVSEYSGPLEHAFDAGSALYSAKRDKTSIYGHTCGGLHLVQAVATGVAESGDDGLRRRFRKQLGVLLYRYDLERTAYASLLSRHPDQGLIIRVQQQKFLGHLLETLTLARELQLTDPSSEGGKRIDTVIRQSAGDVAVVARELSSGGVYDRLESVRRKREQSYLDLVGDGCHAIRGLRRALALY